MIKLILLLFPLVVFPAEVTISWPKIINAASYELTHNTGNITITYFLEQSQFKIDISENQKHTFTVTAIDKSGNRSEPSATSIKIPSFTKQYKLDKPQPKITIQKYGSANISY